MTFFFPFFLSLFLLFLLLLLPFIFSVPPSSPPLPSSPLSAEQEDNFMRAWLNLVSERNALVRRTADLSLQMKLFELEDRQYELQKEMRDMQENEDGLEETSNPQFDKLLDELVDVVHERDQIIQQIDIDRIRLGEEERKEGVRGSRGRELFVMPFPFICRELEEQEAESEMLNHHFDCKPPFTLSHTLPPSLL